MPSPQCKYTEEEREALGVENEEEDTEVLVCRMEELTDMATLPILVRHTDKNEIMTQLKEDIKKGSLRKGLREEGYKECFTELSVQKAEIMRGERLIIPKTLRVRVLEAVHQGHPGQQSMTRQIRQSCWWRGMNTDIKDFVETCLPCLVAVDRNKMDLMHVRGTPERPWQHCSADYKGPIAGKYYFHILIDNYSRWPEMQMVTSTSFGQLQGKMEDSFSIHRVPESITHDNRPCYNSADWMKFGQKWGFQSQACMLENPKANGIAEIHESVGKDSTRSGGRRPRPQAGSEEETAKLQKHTSPINRKNASGVNDEEANQNKSTRAHEANTRRGRQGGKGAGWKDEEGEEREI